MKLVLPIAGKGSRFLKEADRNPEYLKPKPLISVRGVPMVRWATGSLPFVYHSDTFSAQRPLITSRDIIFLAFQGHEDDYRISSILRAIYGNDIHVIFVPEELRCGAAATTLAARELINTDEPIIVSDSDHFFDGSVLETAFQAYPDVDGIIPLFHVPDKNPKWSFSRVNEEGYIVETAEKNPISEWANIGAYYFGRGKDFVRVATEAMERKDIVNGEYYIAPLYNKLIQQGKKIRPVFPKYVYGLGTPADLSYFLEHTTYTLN